MYVCVGQRHWGLVTGWKQTQKILQEMQLPAVVPAVGRNWVKGWSRWKWCFSVGTDGSFICQLNHDWELRPLTNPEKSCELNCLGWFPCYVNSTRKGTTTHSIHSLGISTVNDTKAWRSFTQLWKLMAVFSDRDCISSSTFCLVVCKLTVLGMPFPRSYKVNECKVM